MLAVTAARHVWLALALAVAPAAAAPTSSPPPSAPAPASPQARLFTPGIRDAAHPGRWVREFERRKAILRGESGPAAVLALLGLVYDLHGEIPRDELLAFVDAARKHREPLVASYAGYVRGQLLEHEGVAGKQEAEAALRAEGYLLDWQIVGPFDNSGRGGHDQVFEPETAPFSAGQTFVGKLPGEPLPWRQFTHARAPRSGFINLADLLQPDTNATGYATLWIRSDRAADAALHIGAAGAYKIWLDGVLVGEAASYHSPNPLQDAHPLRLQAGWNRLLIKLGADEGLWGFYARISAPSGAPLTGLEIRSLAPDSPQLKVEEVGAKSSKPPAKLKPVRSLRGLLEERARGPRARAADKLALVEFYRWTTPFAPEDRTAVDRAREADEAAKSARSAQLLSILDPDQNSSRTALLAGIERARKEGRASAPLLAAMLADLSLRYQSLGLEQRGRELLDEAFATTPDDVLIELTLANRLAGDGFPLSALEWVEDMLQRYPGSALLLRDKAERLLELGRTEPALALLQQLAGADPTDAGLARQIADCLLRLGKPDAAAEIGRRRAAAVPGLPDAFREVARLEEARGDLTRARAAIQAAVDLAPQDADLHNALARLAARDGDTAAAIRSVRRSLALRPQQPDLRDYLATLDASQKDDLLARYPVDFEALAKKPTPKSWAGKDAGVLLHRTVVRVLPNGLTERLEHRVVRILDDRGIRSQAVQGMVYDPAEAYVDVRRARVRRADGRIEEIGDPTVVSLTDAGYRMFYDQRQQRVNFSGLRVGDVLEVAFLRRDTALRNKFDDYFGELAPLEGFEPQLLREYILEAPASRKLYFNQPVKQEPGPSPDIVRYRLTSGERRGVKPESAMPGWTELVQYLHVSTFSDWDAVGRWYWNLVKEQLVVDAKIKAAVQDVLKRLPKGATERDKVRALYKHVITSTRYVGLEFGIHGFKPYRTTDVYDRRFGDCKDKASLLKVMLAEAGIESHLVLVRTRDQGALGPTPASLSAFNHAITYVPSLDLYLDGTAEFSGPDELPTADQGAAALIVRDGKGAEFTTIPVSKPGDNRQIVHQTIELKPDGGADVKHLFTVTGASAASWRSALQAAEHRKERLTQVWGAHFPGLEIRELDAPGIGDVLQPVQIRTAWAVPAWAQRQGEVLRFNVLGHRTGLQRALAGQTAREHDLVMAAPATEINVLEVTAPKGYTFGQVPAEKTFEAPFARFSLTVSSAGDRAQIRTELEYRTHRFKAADYRALREFLGQVDGALEQAFELRPEPRGAN
jgi:Flp pilus assembly protein TadD/transglutaminase-like putative cysteine protease